MKKSINISFPSYIRWDGVIPTFVKGYNRTLIIDTEKNKGEPFWYK